MSLKSLVNSPDVYAAFIQYVEDKIKVTYRSLEVATKPEDIYRLQGQITCLRRFLTLRDEVNYADKS